MFGWIRTSHETQVQSPAVLGLGQVEMTAAQHTHYVNQLFNTPPCKIPIRQHKDQYQDQIQRSVFHSWRLFFRWVESLRGWGSLPTPGCISGSGTEFGAWMKASGSQSISPLASQSQTGTQWTLERMFFLFVYQDASGKLYLISSKLDIRIVI